MAVALTAGLGLVAVTGTGPTGAGTALASRGKCVAEPSGLCATTVVNATAFMPAVQPSTNYNGASFDPSGTFGMVTGSRCRLHAPEWWRRAPMAAPLVPSAPALSCLAGPSAQRARGLRGRGPPGGQRLRPCLVLRRAADVAATNQPCPSFSSPLTAAPIGSHWPSRGGSHRCPLPAGSWATR